MDTSIYIFFLRGKLNFDDIIRKKGLENCFISEITVFELKYGATAIIPKNHTKRLTIL